MIYFIQVGNDGPIKIGFTKKAHKRLKSLETSCPYPIRFLSTMPGTRADEKTIHKKFHSFRIHGEWFKPDQDLVDWAKNNRSVPKWEKKQKAPEKAVSPKRRLLEEAYERLQVAADTLRRKAKTSEYARGISELEYVFGQIIEQMDKDLPKIL